MVVRGGKDPFLDGVIAEITSSLKQYGGRGSISLESLRERTEGRFSSIREIFAHCPDKFRILEEKGDKIKIELVPEGEQGSRGAGGDLDRELTDEELAALSESAIAEVEAECLRGGGEADVWIKGWWSRYGRQLGEFKRFLQNFPHKFRIHGHGTNYTVQLLDGAGNPVGGDPESDALLAQAALKEVEAQCRQVGLGGKVRVPGWHHRYGHRLGELIDFVANYPETFEVVGTPAEFTIELIADQRDQQRLELLRAAVQEIEESLRRAGGQGRPLVVDWPQRFGVLGNLMEFVRRFPANFTVIPHSDQVTLETPEVGNATCGLAIEDTPDEAVTQQEDTWSEEQLQRLADQAFADIMTQLAAQGGQGRVSLPNWSTKYARLGPLQGFIAQFADKFKVVRAINGDTIMALGPEIPPTEKDPAFARILGTPVRMEVHSPFRDMDARLIRGAVVAIEECLRSMGGVGLVYLEGWSERFGSLGPFKAFVEAHPQRFILLERAQDYCICLPSFIQSRSKRGFLQPDLMDFDPYAVQAIREVEAKLRRVGGEGKVWIERWWQRFGGRLGSFRAFLERHPDRFRVMLAPNFGYKVRLAEGFGETSSQNTCQPNNAATAAAAAAGAAGANGTIGLYSGHPLIQRAIAEMERHLDALGGSGKLSMDNWWGRYGALGDMEAFVRSLPQHFTVLPSPTGGEFLVALAKNSAAVSSQAFRDFLGAEHPLVLEAAADIERQLVLQGGRGYIRTAPWMERFPSLGSMRRFLDQLPEKFKFHSGVGVGGTVLFVSLVGAEDETSLRLFHDRAAAAIEEIKEILDPVGGEGRVDIEDWWQRYGILGDLREFVECRPDHFEVLLGSGHDFAVRALVPGLGSRAKAGLRLGFRRDDPLVGQAVAEIELELRAAGGESELELESWQRRYGHLGDLRSFVRAFPNKFIISPSGRGLIVGLLAPIDLDSGHPLIDQAASEVAARLAALGGFGRLRIHNWEQRFKQLGDFRAFLEHFTEAFHVVPGEGDDFAVGLASMVRDDYLEIEPGSGQLKRMPLTLDLEEQPAKRQRTDAPAAEQALALGESAVNLGQLFRRVQPQK